MPETNWNDLTISTVVPYRWPDEIGWEDEAIWNDGEQWDTVDAASEE